MFRCEEVCTVPGGMPRFLLEDCRYRFVGFDCYLSRVSGDAIGVVRFVPFVEEFIDKYFGLIRFLQSIVGVRIRSVSCVCLVNIDDFSY